MISIDYGIDGDELRLVCTGHAGYAPGEDIVCAGVSALCGALAATLFLNEESFERLTVAEAQGETAIFCSGGNAAPYFEVIVTGLRKIAEAYPFNVCIGEQGEG